VLEKWFVERNTKFPDIQKMFATEKLEAIFMAALLER
jgi:hypothetical protein